MFRADTAFILQKVEEIGEYWFGCRYRMFYKYARYQLNRPGNGNLIKIAERSNF